jgi:hypothetical protein
MFQEGRRASNVFRRLHRRGDLWLGLAETFVIRPTKENRDRMCRDEKHFLPKEK